MASVHGLHFGGHGLAQSRYAGHGRVLVQTLGHGRGHPLHQTRVAIEIRKALAEIDSLVLGGQRRHHGKNSGADFGQFGLQAGA